MMRLGKCDKPFCREQAVAFSGDGDALCEDHLFAWMEKECEADDPHADKETKDDEAD